ncbi:MAG: pyruvate, water dikinase regulatory protein [Candidatus Caldatribacteriota bacterium]|nr:pyruvate, water dikinase regulatory protein [Candidatus Caldatribacteriota bacterium]
MKNREDRSTIYIMSDSTGETAQMIVRAATSQFVSDNIRVKLFAHIESIKDIKGIIEKIEKEKSMIIYTIIKPELKLFLKEESEKRSIVSFDLIGPIIENIERISKISPKLEPGIIRKYDKEYFKRMEAMEFTVKYDSCQGELDLSKADLVILGVSRTSKTPLSMYLAHKGVKVANIILDYEFEPPSGIFDLPKEKVIGLRIEPDKLIEIRSERLKTLGLSDDSIYANKDRILKELKFAEDVYRKVGCTIINIGNKAIEDIATEILKILEGEE